MYEVAVKTVCVEDTAKESWCGQRGPWGAARTGGQRRHLPEGEGKGSDVYSLVGE